MKLSDLHLGDVVEVSRGGYAVVIALDPAPTSLPVMLGWNSTDCKLRSGRDNYHIPGAKYVPNVEAMFQYSLWVSINSIERAQSQHITATELPCRQCKRMNDITAASCWWCETENPTS